MNSQVKRKRNARVRLFKEQRGLCYYCAKPMLLARGAEPGQCNPKRLVTLDHIIPRSMGGPLSPSTNAVAACLACNGERGTKDARLFMLEKQGMLA